MIEWLSEFTPQKIGDIGIDRQGKWWIMIPGGYIPCNPRLCSDGGSEAAALGLMDVESEWDYLP